MKRLLLTLFYFGITYSSWSQETVWKGEDASILYQEQSESYLLKTSKGEKTFPRHQYKELLRTLGETLDDPIKEMEGRKAFLPFHYKLKVIEPTLAESLQSSFDMQTDALEVIENPQGTGCGHNSYFSRKGPRLSMRLGEESEAELQKSLLNLKMNEDGFFLLGDLIGMKVKWRSANDNIGHGLYRNLGGDIDSNLEGDDRGFTFGTAESVELEFQKGHVKLEHYADGYSRLAPQKRAYTINGQEYVGTFHKDENGRHYQEILNVEGVKLEVRRAVGTDDVYVKVIGKAERLTDQSGTAIKLQEAWHKANEDNGVIQYNNVDHIKDKSRVGAGFSIGKDWTVHETRNFRIKTNGEVGGYLSSDGPHDSYIEARGSLTIDSNNYGAGDSRTPAYEAKLYAEKRVYGEDYDDSVLGFEVRRNWNINEKNFFYLSSGVEDNNNRFSNDYGQEELDERGRLDLNWFYGVGWEHRF